MKGIARFTPPYLTPVNTLRHTARSLAAALLLVMTACTAEIPGEETTQAAGTPIILTLAESADPQTRISEDTDGNIQWTGDEKVAVKINNKVCQYVVKKSGNTTTLQPDGPGNTHYWSGTKVNVEMWYPYATAKPSIITTPTDQSKPFTYHLEYLGSITPGNTNVKMRHSTARICAKIGHGYSPNSPIKSVKINIGEGITKRVYTPRIIGGRYVVMLSTNPTSEIKKGAELFTITLADGKTYTYKQPKKLTLMEGESYDYNITLRGAVIDLSKGSATISSDGNYTVIGSSKTNTLTINGGSPRVTLSGITLDLTAGDPPIRVRNCSPTFVLQNKNTVRTTVEKAAAIYVDYQSTLTIEGSGELIADGGKDAASIGGNYGEGCKKIIIKSGTITASGQESSAAIGAGYWQNCESIEILGGKIMVSVYSLYSQSLGVIGGGLMGNCGSIKLRDCTIEMEKSGFTSQLRSFKADRVDPEKPEDPNSLKNANVHLKINDKVIW